ncbi:MAG: hypothetical protein A2W11_13105 [Ignavibacteria bacterium RBG_16_35_7]|nr:MAG: hypothetical protein A2W11_13105 [Ignavibacteria bacterium RBG_16_35_7]
MENLTNILKLKTSDWSRMLKLCIQWIQADFKVGKMQDGKSNLQYLSEQYKKYKASGMRRLTKSGKAKAFDPSGDYRGNRLYGKRKATAKGRRVSGFYAKSIESTNTAFVDMTLTGNLKKGLHVKAVTEQGGTIGYEPSDAKKLEGNRRYGREVVGLNEENQEKLKKEIIEIFQKNAQTILVKDVKIQITL